jgi:flagellar hook-associated protein FlgK
VSDEQSLFSSKIMTTNISLGTPKTHSQVGGKVKIFTASGGDHSITKFTIVGTDQNGDALTEVIGNGPLSGRSVVGGKVFKTISSITPQPISEIVTSANVSTVNDTITISNHMLSTGSKITYSNGSGADITGLSNNTDYYAIVIDANTIKLASSLTNANSNTSISLTGTGNDNQTFTRDVIGSGSVDIDLVITSDASLNPPSDITLSWTDNASGTTDDDALFQNAAVSGSPPSKLQLNGALTSQDTDSLYTTKTGTSGLLNLDGVLKNNKELRSVVQIAFSGAETGKTFTVAGYDLDGIYKTDVINGPNGASTVEGSVQFREVISITASSATANNIQIGTRAESANVNGSVISITSSGDESNNEFTIVGKDMFGNDQTEIIMGGNATSVNGEKVFKSITSITPSSATGVNTIKVGTISTGRFSISHEIGKSNFSIDRNPNVQDVYGIKTQRTRAIINEGKIELNSLNGQPISVDIPAGSTSNIVSEQISISNLPNEELIAVVMGGGARRINAEFNFVNDNHVKEEPEYEIKIDKTNKNKIEIFDKEFGHSISTRILDNARSFEAIGSRFQFSDEALIGESFLISNNNSGSGDNRNINNMLDLQLDKMQSKGKGNFQQIFSNTVAKVGSSVQTNKLSLTAAEANKDAAESALSEFAGVSLDDEAAHLLEFQQAYQASARLLQTARELFQSLIEVV